MNYGGKLSSELSLGSLAPGIAVEALMNTEAGPLCYIYM